MIPIRRNKVIKSSGIYQIESYINGKLYIGSTNYFSRRIFQEHILGLKRGNHPNIHLQRHVNKYGIDDLWFDILEFCHKQGGEPVENFRKRLRDREQHFIDLYDSANPKKGFNILPKAMGGSLPGRKQSEKEKEKRRILWSNLEFKKEVAQTMKKNHADFSGKNHPNYGKKINGGKHRFRTGHTSHVKGIDHKGYGIKHKYPKIRKRRTEESLKQQGASMKKYWQKRISEKNCIILKTNKL